ncbi:hypothetical protein ED733_000595 [Metarhizium rileyi]|uniref:Uncharacterized protein n=1 Tax=Metarhizium rileyi (strain RCEF 4871) TaxID=1649241 RepID=A0A5C6G3M3_METRR|nr:hypothetical protein ED733_000595 [Metarhizium rileyi]
MDLVVSSLGPVKVESRLQQSLDGFIQDLTPNQKTDFLRDRQVFRERHPDENDVFVFVAELNNRRASQKKLCHGPRFLNIIQAAQQFAFVGDILVGGSQNLIASGVWTALRTALLIVAKAGGNMDKLSHLFMVAGQSAPRYEAMSRLYSRKSRRLLAYYHEYFIVLVDMCRRFVNMVNKSSVARLFSTISDADIRSFQSSVAHWASMIKEEAMLLMAQGVEDQGLSLSGMIDVSKRDKSNAHRQQQLKDKARILAACSTHDHQASWKRLRKMGSTTLFSHDDKYISWRGDVDALDEPRTLIYTGKLGAGKSVLVANMVEDLNLHAVQSKIPVAYFFCQHDEVASLQARCIVGSLARQLLLTAQDISKAKDHIHDHVQELGLDELSALLKDVLATDFRAYCVIDGLDECDSQERGLLILTLRELQDSLALRVCFSFRLEADNALRLDTKGFVNCSIAAIPEDNPEIEQFICDELERCIDNEVLTLGDPTLVADIMNTLVDLSQGMFLWTVLQINSLCACKTDNDIRQALADMPKDLAETFTRVLSKCDASARRYQKQILELILVARRPLTTEDLREMLAVVSGDTNWNPSRLPNNIYSVLAGCGGLLTVDEETSSIRMVHQSARDFLLGAFGGRTGEPLLTREAAETTMSWTAITYLNYGIFDTQLSRTAASSAPIPIMTPSAAIQSCSRPGTVKRLSLMLLRARKSSSSSSSSSKVDMARVLEDIRGQTKKTAGHNHQFYSYAAANWTHHVMKTQDVDQTFISLIRRLLPKHPLIGHSDETRFNFLAWAASQDRVLYKLLLHAETNNTPWFQHDMLSWAVRQGHIQLLETHDHTMPLTRHTTASLLPIAALYGHFPCVNHLVSNLGDALPATSLATAIMTSIFGNHARLVHFLLTGTHEDPSPTSPHSNDPDTAAPATNTQLARQGRQMLHNRPQSRKLLHWAQAFRKDHLARLLIDLGAKTTDALQPKLEEELRSQTSDYAESLREETAHNILMYMDMDMDMGSASAVAQTSLDMERERILILAARILFDTSNVSLLNAFLIASQGGPRRIVGSDPKPFGNATCETRK